MKGITNQLKLLAYLVFTAGSGFLCLPAFAHPGHGKSFGTAEEPEVLFWVWLSVIGVCALFGIWRLYSALTTRKK